MRRTVATICMLILILTMGRGICFAAQREIKGPINIEADELTYERDTDMYHASGNVLATFTDGFLKADTVTMDRQTGNAWAVGKVRIRSGSDLLEGDVVFFNLDEKTGTIYDGKIFISENHMYLRGDEIEKRAEATYFLKNAIATSCDGDKPAWRLTAKELDVDIDGYGTMKDGSFQINNRQVIFLPYFVFPAKTTRQSGLLMPNVAFSKENGLDLQIPYYWAISENTDATFYQRIITSRGYMQGAEYRYYLSKDSFGTIYGDYLKDYKSESDTQGGLSRNWTDPHDRWSYYVNHETTFSPGFYFRSDLRKISDHWYFRDFSDFNYYLEHYSQNQNKRFERVSFLADESLSTLDSTARLVKSFGNFYVTAMMQYTDTLSLDSNDTTLQKYPELTVTAMRQPLGKTGFNYEVNSIYDYYYRKQGSMGHYGDILPVVSRPITQFGDYLQLTPFAAFRETVWDSSGEGVSPTRDSRPATSVGTTAATEFYRIFDFGNKGEGLEKIRHSVRPELNYTLTSVQQGNAPDYVTAINQANLATYAVSNFLTTKLKGSDGKPVYSEILRLRFIQSYDINEGQRKQDPGSPDTRPFGPLYIDGDLKPFKYMVYHADTAYNPNSGSWIRSNHDLTVSDSRGDSATVSYRYSQAGTFLNGSTTQIGPLPAGNYNTQIDTREIDLYLKAKATATMDVFYVWRQDTLDGTSLENTVGIVYHKQCWKVEVSYSNTVSDQRIMVMFTLLGLGSTGKVGTPVGF